MNQPRRSDTDSINFLVATPRAVTSTEAARVQPRRPHAPAHDAFTRLLHRLEPAPATLWDEVAPLVDQRRGVLVLDAAALPWLPGARAYAAEGVATGGRGRNKGHFAARVTFADDVDETTRGLVFEAETSGGLLLALAPEAAHAFLTACAAEGQPAWHIGHVTSGVGVVLA